MIHHRIQKSASGIARCFAGCKKVRVELHDTHVEMKQKYKETLKQNNDNKRRSDEILWAEIFNNTIYGSSWLEDKTFPLEDGRLAIPVLMCCIVF